MTNLRFVSKTVARCSMALSGVRIASLRKNYLALHRNCFRMWNVPLRTDEVNCQFAKTKALPAILYGNSLTALEWVGKFHWNNWQKKLPAHFRQNNMNTES